MPPKSAPKTGMAFGFLPTPLNNPRPAPLRSSSAPSPLLDALLNSSQNQSSSNISTILSAVEKSKKWQLVLPSEDPTLVSKLDEQTASDGSESEKIQSLKETIAKASPEAFIWLAQTALTTYNGEEAAHALRLVASTVVRDYNSILKRQLSTFWYWRGRLDMIKGDSLTDDEKKQIQERVERTSLNELQECTMQLAGKLSKYNEVLKGIAQRMQEAAMEQDEARRTSRSAAPSPESSDPDSYETSDENYEGAESYEAKREGYRGLNSYFSDSSEESDDSRVGDQGLGFMEEENKQRYGYADRDYDDDEDRESNSDDVEDGPEYDAEDFEEKFQENFKKLNVKK
ncbi:hypothetical protein F4821DRAFT_254574 [Hypoxylon rubiginosum]|uniref:Uncharacterized protein n=1 Tax=Hypoxylon rubiginosum TaxID=110542 RepID=A0ACC0DGD0_9PEZI|nr:hypothetical protein F4821DRAFT_254574 [Hypoxylon rubiginosum]